MKHIELMKTAVVSPSDSSLDSALNLLASGVGAVHLKRALNPSRMLGDNHTRLHDAFAPHVRLRTHTSDPNSIIWDIRKRDEQEGDRYRTFSETSTEAWFHTDSSYSAHPEAYFALWCLKSADCGGGENIIIDAAELLRILARSGEGVLDTLTKSMPFRIPDIFRAEGGPTCLWAAIFGANGSLRYRYDTLCAGLSEQGSRAHPESRAAIEEVQSALRRCQRSSVRLHPGDLLLVSNLKALHARTAFRDRLRHLLRVRFDL